MRRRKKICSLVELCRRSGVEREAIDAFLSALVEAAVSGETVLIPRMGKFWIKEMRSKELQVPVGQGPLQLIRIPKTLSLRFTSSAGFKQYLRIRARGRARGTE